MRDGVRQSGRRGGRGNPLLLLHGHPQTHAMWHRVAPRLAEVFTVVMMDLRGYGESGRPDPGDGSGAYSKRQMALDAQAVMQAHGFDRYQVLAHDRGARVAHRLAADHPQAVQRLLLLDIAPTLAMYQLTTEAFARSYWHWFFLIQRAGIDLEHDRADTQAGRGSSSRCTCCAESTPPWAAASMCFRSGAIAHRRSRATVCPAAITSRKRRRRLCWTKHSGFLGVDHEYPQDRRHRG